MTEYSGDGIRVARRRVLFALNFYTMSFFLNEVFTIRLGPVFFRPEKIAVFGAFLLVFRYIPIVFQTKRGTLLLYVFAFYSIIIGSSALYAPGLSLASQLNVLFKFLAEIGMIYGIFGALVRVGSISVLRPFLALFVFINVVELLAGTGDYLLGHRIIHSGVTKEGWEYGIGIHGFHHERLYFAEYLIFGSAILLGYTVGLAPARIWRFIRHVLNPFFILLTFSTTGMLGFSLLMLSYLYKSSIIKKLVLVFVIAVLGIGLFPILYTRLAPAQLQESRQKKLDERMEGESSHAWRYLSSVILVEYCQDNMSLTGSGFMSTGSFLGRELGVASTPHTIVSICYEQGYLGMLAFTGYIGILLLTFTRMFFMNAHLQFLDRSLLYFLYALFFCSMLRYAFYYQVKNEYLQVLMVALISAAYHYSRTGETPEFQKFIKKEEGKL